jgi:SRSO17 transposase
MAAIFSIRLMSWSRLLRLTAEPEPDPVWVVDDTGFPKKGEHSVGVERQYSGTLGKTANCQVAVSLHHVGEHGSTALGWRLYLVCTKNSKLVEAYNLSPCRYDFQFPSSDRR